MFAKPFRVKSNTMLKGSDRRKLRTDISHAFPVLQAEQVADLLPSKEELNVVKIYAHKGEAVTLYVLHRNPIFFEMEKRLYPTVYTLWRHPELLPAFTTWPAVLHKLVGGADLMLPGVVVPPGGLPEVKQGERCAVTLVGNRAPVAIGTSTMSTSEMLCMKGRGVSILHTYMDSLWAFGDKSEVPTLPINSSEELAQLDPCQMEQQEEAEPKGDPEPAVGLSGEDEHPGNDPCVSVQELSLTEAQRERERESVEEEQLQDNGTSSQEQVDSLLRQCFLHALKSKVKKSDLPLLTSTFLRNHMFRCCPTGKQLDIKKSSYKKLSKFLQAMQQLQLIQVKELSKGVASIVEVDWRHPELRSFIPPEQGPTEGEGPAESTVESDRPYQPPDITALYIIPARLEPLFHQSQRKKGVVLSPAEVRCIISEYVKKNELVDEQNKNYININPTLCDCLLEKSEYQGVEKLKWDDLFSRTMDRMQHAYQVLFPGQQPIIRKGRIEPIDISVASRGSNKKVTIIKNLELYGIEPAGVAAALQHRVQASSGLVPVPGSKDRVLVQIQGNQVQHAGNLLLDYYRIPRKYIQGLEKAPKPGKKK